MFVARDNTPIFPTLSDLKEKPNTDFWNHLFEFVKDNKNLKGLIEHRINRITNVDLDVEKLPKYKAYVLLNNISFSLSQINNKNILVKSLKYNTEELVRIRDLIISSENVFVANQPVFNYNEKTLQVSEHKNSIEYFINLFQRTVSNFLHVEYIVYSFNLLENGEISMRYATYEKEKEVKWTDKELTDENVGNDKIIEDLKESIKELSNRLDKLEEITNNKSKGVKAFETGPP